MRSQSTTVGTRELKTRLGTYLRQVRAGATLVVTDRGRPIAELRPLEMPEDGLSYALDDLTARGVLGGTLGERLPLEDFEPIEAHTSSSDPAASDASLSDAVIADREDRF